METETLRAPEHQLLQKVGEAETPAGPADDDEGEVREEYVPRGPTGLESFVPLTFALKPNPLMGIAFHSENSPFLGHTWALFHVPRDSLCRRELEPLIRMCLIYTGRRTEENSTGLGDHPIQQ